MDSIQSQHGLRSQNANKMLTLFRKFCFDGKNSQSLVLTVKTTETPVKSRVSAVLKGAERRSKCSKRHPHPTTRNQFASNRTRVRIPPAAPEQPAGSSGRLLFYSFAQQAIKSGHVGPPSHGLKNPLHCKGFILSCIKHLCYRQSTKHWNDRGQIPVMSLKYGPQKNFLRQKIWFVNLAWNKCDLRHKDSLYLRLIWMSASFFPVLRMPTLSHRRSDGFFRRGWEHLRVLI